MIKTLILGAFALVATAGAANARVITVDFSASDAATSFVGSFTFDMNAIRGTTSSGGGGTYTNFDPVDYTFEYTVTSSGQSVSRTGSYLIQVANDIDISFGRQDMFIAYAPIEGTTANLNLWLGFDPARWASTDLPDNLDGATFVNVASPRAGIFLPATYAVRYADAAVPEAATWAMMIAGVGAIGGSLRRRHVKAKLATA